jgi:hypothetical protein
LLRHSYSMFQRWPWELSHSDRGRCFASELVPFEVDNNCHGSRDHATTSPVEVRNFAWVRIACLKR